MQQHEENIGEIFQETQEKLAKNIKEAEHRKAIPDEAVVCTITNSIVFWGNEIERKRFKKKWIKQQTVTMSGEMDFQLKKIGRVVSVTPIANGKGEIWHIWDTADVHMTKKAKDRVEANASEEELGKQAAVEKEVNVFEEENG